MYKKFINVCVCLVALISFINIFKGYEVHASSIKNNILIIYDKYKPYASDENTLMYLNEITLSIANEVDVININDLNYELIRKYNSIIVLLNEDRELINTFKKEIKNFIGNIVWIGENYNQINNKNNIKYLSLESLNSNTQHEIFNFLYDSSLWTNRTYLLIDDVNPFIDLNELVEKIDYLNKKGIQFILSTIPVFENKDFNSVKRFTEILRYAQVKGGYVVLHSPYIMDNSVDSSTIANDVIKKSEIGWKNYINYLVYPLTFDVPSYFIYMDSMRNFLDRTNTIILDESNSKDIMNFSFYKNNKFKNILYKVDYKSIDDIKYRYLNNIVISVNNNIPYKKFKEIINSFNSKEIYFNDLIYINAKLELLDNKLELNTQGIFLNYRPVTQSKYISNESLENARNRGLTVKENNKEISIEKPKNVAIIMSIASIIIFVVIVILSRKIDKKKYFK